MATVHDVAAYILARQGSMTAMKLEKLCYYAQAWSLVWDGKALFPERIEAWRNGPVIPALYHQHRGKFVVDSWPQGRSDCLTPDEQDTVNVVLSGYGNFTPAQLSELTHQEEPWQSARGTLGPMENGNNPIDLNLMQEFYDAMMNADTRSAEE